MHFLEAAVAIVAIVMISQVIRSFFGNRAAKTDRNYETLTRQMARMEERITNLETILVDREKEERFADLERRDAS